MEVIRRLILLALFIAYCLAELNPTEGEGKKSE
jgi:hypothetical protein